MKLTLASLVATLLLSVSNVFAEAPPPAPIPMLVHVEIGGTEHAVFVSPDGDGTLEIDVPGQVITKLKVRLTRRGQTLAPGVAFDVMHVASDKSSYIVRGEIALPAQGKPVLVARIPQKGKSLDIFLSLTPAR